MPVEIGQLYTLINEDGSVITGVVLSTFRTLSGKPMYVMQRRSDMQVFMGEEGPITRPRKKFLEWVTTKN